MHKYDEKGEVVLSGLTSITLISGPSLLVTEFLSDF